MKWQELKCKMGFHKWVTTRRYSVKIPVANTFTGACHKVRGEAIFQECKHCRKAKSYADTGEQTQTFDTGMMAREAIRNIPSLIQDKLMREYASL